MVRVLVVDDNENIRLIIAEYIREVCGYNVFLAENGQEALDMILRGNIFDVVISDVNMPELTGLELFKEVSQACPDLAKRFIFMTGNALELPGLRKTGRPSFEKPFSLTDLGKMIGEVLLRGGQDGI
jgi:CheY-like chemotaxis protein